jgi:hypothetical protein
MPTAIAPLYVKLSAQDKASLCKLAAECGMVEGRPVTVADVVRQLVRDAVNRSTPVRLKPEKLT